MRRFRRWCSSVMVLGFSGIHVPLDRIAGNPALCAHLPRWELRYAASSPYPHAWFSTSRPARIGSGRRIDPASGW